MEAFKEKVERLFQRHEELITRKNVAVEDGNGIFTRYKYPVVTAAHTPVFWRYDLDEVQPVPDGTYRYECDHEFGGH